MARAAESPRLGLPQRHVAAGVRADARVRHDALRRSGARVRGEILRGQPDEQDLVQPRAVANDLAAGIDGIGQQRRLAGDQIAERDHVPLALATGEHETISGLGALGARITRLGRSPARRTEKGASAQSGSEQRAAWPSKATVHRSLSRRDCDGEAAGLSSGAVVVLSSLSF